MKRAALASIAFALLFAGRALSEEAAPRDVVPRVPAVKKDCNLCHKLSKHGTRVLLKMPLSQLCLDCHPERKPPAEHVVDVVPTMEVDFLPLDSKGRMTCATCHEPHGLTGKVKMLRGTKSEICGYCHKM
jgi:predicted CXXCH cytochrome family protein